MRHTLTFLLIFCCSTSLFAQEYARIFSLDQVIDQAKSKSISSKLASSIKENKYFSFLNYKAGLRPQLSLVGNVLGYSKDYFGVVQPDGNLLFQSRTQNYSNVGLSLSQQIGATGGVISVNSNLARFDDFDRDEKRYNSIPINISLSQPLFAFNGFKWDKKIEPLKFIESEKEYIKEVSNIAYETSRLYFNVLDAQSELKLAEKNIAYQTSIYELENKKIELGTTSKDKLLQLQVQLLTYQNNFNAAEVNLRKSILLLKNYAGMQYDSIQVTLPESLPMIKISVEEAIKAVRTNKPEFIAFQRRKLEAEKELEQARKQRFQVNLLTAYGYSNTGNNLSNVYRSPNEQQSLTLSVQLPILDWGRNKGRISLAASNLNTVKYTIEQEELSLIQEVSNLLDNIKLLNKSLSTAKKADEIALERYQLAVDQYRFGKVSITDLHIALGEKDQASRSYLNTLREFWLSYYQLRLLTLLDL